MSLDNLLKYTWPILIGSFALLILYLFKFSFGQYVIVYGLTILLLIPILEVVIQGRSVLLYAMAGAISGLILGLVISSYVGESLTDIIFKASIREMAKRPDLVIWNFLFSSVFSSSFALLGGWVGRKGKITNMSLLIFGTFLGLTSTILLSNYLLIKAIGSILGLYIAIKGATGIEKKNPYL